MLRLPQEIDQRLDELARRTKRTTSFHAREAIVEYLEDVEDTNLAREAVAERTADGAVTMSTEELLARYA